VTPEARPASLPTRLGVVAPLLLAVAVLAVDQVSKAWVTENLAYRQPMVIVPFLDGGLNLTYGHNSGAVFGIFPQGNLIFTAVAAVVVLVILAYYRYLADHSGLVRLSLGLMLGGALGNLTDRLHYGYVVDFVDFGISPTVRWFTFNVADSCVFCGVVILAFFLFFASANPDATVTSSPPTGGPGDQGIEKTADLPSGPPLS
jgi:signal peptidase II